MDEVDMIKDERLSATLDMFFNVIHKRMSELMWQKEGESFEVDGMSSRKIARHLAVACLNALLEEIEMQG